MRRQHPSSYSKACSDLTCSKGLPLAELCSATPLCHASDMAIAQVAR
jgi:hypothetical protein